MFEIGNSLREARVRQGLEISQVELATKIRSKYLRAIEDELADPGAWATPDAATRSTARHEAAKRTVAELYSRWEAVAG